MLKPSDINFNFGYLSKRNYANHIKKLFNWKKYFSCKIGSCKNQAQMNCSKARIFTNQVTDGLHFGSLEAENQNLGLLLASTCAGLCGTRFMF